MQAEKETDRIEQSFNKKAHKAVIISGGSIDREYVLSVFKEKKFEIIIAADAGLDFLHNENIEPTHIVGDFDSLPQGILDDYMGNPNVKVRIFNPIKDKTDTEIAVNLAIELDASEIWIMGGTGGRIDHTIGNIQTMMIPLKKRIPCILADDQNEIQLIDHSGVIAKSNVFGKYISFIPFGGSVKGLTITGVKYPLNNFTLLPEGSLGISNEIVDELAFISFTEGILMVIQSRDRSNT